jgi:hypothetical protein
MVTGIMGPIVIEQDVMGEVNMGTKSMEQVIL